MPWLILIAAAGALIGVLRLVSAHTHWMVGLGLGMLAAGIVMGAWAFLSADDELD